MLNGSQHGHEQHGSHAGSAATYSPFASERSAVSIEGCDTDQGCDLLVGERTQFRQVSKQGVNDLISDPRCGEQDVSLHAPLINGFDQLDDHPINLIDLCLEMPCDAPNKSMAN